jgi:hypothetical protein
MSELSDGTARLERYLQAANARRPATTAIRGRGS